MMSTMPAALTVRLAGQDVPVTLVEYRPRDGVPETGLPASERRHAIDRAVVVLAADITWTDALGKTVEWHAGDPIELSAHKVQVQPC